MCVCLYLLEHMPLEIPPNPVAERIFCTWKLGANSLVPSNDDAIFQVQIFSTLAALALLLVGAALNGVDVRPRPDNPISRKMCSTYAPFSSSGSKSLMPLSH